MPGPNAQGPQLFAGANRMAVQTLDVNAPTFNFNGAVHMSAPAYGHLAPRASASSNLALEGSAGSVLPPQRIALLRLVHNLFTSLGIITPAGAVQQLSQVENTAPLPHPKVSDSQEDVSLSQLEQFIDIRLLDWPRLTIPEVYVCSMLGSGNGLACWNTRPRRPVAGENGVIPGDVGTFTAEGGFKRMFNLWIDEETIRLTTAGLGKAEYRSPPSLVEVACDAFMKGSTIAQGAYSEKIYGADPERTLERFEFRYRSEPGAVLAFASSADQEELSDKAALSDHLIEYAEVIYRHANSIRKIKDDEALYVVTDAIKSSSCGLAAFKEPMEAPHNVMALQSWPHSRQEQSPTERWEWTSCGTADAQFQSKASSSMGDLSLFLKGFKLDFSWHFRSGATGQPPPDDSNRGHGPEGDGKPPKRSDSSSRPGDASSGDRDRGTSSGGTLSNNTMSPKGGGDVGTRRATTRNIASQPGDNLSFEGLRIQTQSFPESSRLNSCHPCDIINEYLLNVTGAPFALSHDDDWLSFMSGHALWQKDLPELKAESHNAHSISVTCGVAFLNPDCRPDPEHNASVTTPVPISKPSSTRTNFPRTGSLGHPPDPKLYASKAAPRSWSPVTPPNITPRKQHRKNQDSGIIASSQQKEAPPSRRAVPSSAGHILANLRNTIGRDIINALPLDYWMLRDLPNPVGVSWDPARTCLPGTRTKLIDDIVKWGLYIPSTRATSQILLIADAAGSGKSCLMHSVSERLGRNGCLLASYWFSKMNEKYSSTLAFFSVIIHGLFVDENARAQITSVLTSDDTLATGPPTRLFNEVIIPAAALLPDGKPFVIVVDGLDEGLDPDLITVLATCVHDLPLNLRFVITTRPDYRIMSKLEHLPHVDRYIGSLTGPKTGPDIATYVNHEIKRSSKLSQLPTRLREDFIGKSEGVFLWASLVLRHVKQAHDPIQELEYVLSGSSTRWETSKDGEQRLDALYAGVLSSLPLQDPEFFQAFECIFGAVVAAKEPMSISTLSKLLEPDGVSPERIIGVLSRIRPLLVGFDPSRTNYPVRILHLSIQEYLTKRTLSFYRIDEGRQHLRISFGSLKIIDQDLIPERVATLGYTDRCLQYDKEANSNYSIPKLSTFDVPSSLHYACRHLCDHLAKVGVGLDGTAAHRSLLREIMSSKSIYLLEITAAMGKVIDLWAIREWWFTEPQMRESVLFDIAANLLLMGEFLCDANRLSEAIAASTAANEIYKALNSEDPLIRLAHACGLRKQAVYFEGAGLLEDAQHHHQRAVDALISLQGQVEATNASAGPVKCGLVDMELSLALFNLASAKFQIAKFDDAAVAVTRAIAIQRQICQTDTSTAHIMVPLTRSLCLLSCTLRQQGQVEEAITAAEEGINIQRQIILDSAVPSVFDPKKSSIAIQLRSLSPGQSDGRTCGLLLESCVTRPYRQQDDMRNHGRNLASSLCNLSGLLQRQRQYDEAKGAALQAIVVSRRIGEDEALAQSQAAYSSALYQEGNYKESRIAALKALDIERKLYASSPEVMHRRANFAASLISIAVASLRCEYGRQALATAEEAVAMYRDPAMSSIHRDEMLPSALGTLAEALASRGRVSEAQAALEEGIQMAERVRGEGRFLTRLEQDLFYLKGLHLND